MNLQDAYLTLLAKALTDACHAATTIAQDGLKLAPVEPRESGDDCPALAETMIGLKRMANLRECINTVIEQAVSGDFIECGVWRGGASIYATAVFEAHDDWFDNSREIWLADSFAGLPAPSHPADAELRLHEYPYLAVSLDTVKDNFRRYDLLLPNVKFLQGFFADTLPTIRDHRWSILRCDCDMYSSTRAVLDNLYDGLSVGGFCIIDEYFWMKECRQAVDEFRAERGIVEPIVKIDNQGGFWRRAAGAV